jgi:hypothetical protein
MNASSPPHERRESNLPALVHKAPCDDVGRCRWRSWREWIHGANDIAIDRNFSVRAGFEKLRWGDDERLVRLSHCAETLYPYAYGWRRTAMILAAQYLPAESDGGDPYRAPCVNRSAGRRAKRLVRSA